MKGFRLIACMAILLGTRIVSAETMYVKSPTADLKSSASASAEVLASLPRGTAVSVARKQGSWVQASAGGQEGWIYKFKLSTSKPSSGGGALSGLGGGSVAAREGSSAASIRGLSPTSEKYAGRANIGPQHVAMVKHMESLQVSESEVKVFLKAGKLGEYAETK